MLPNAKRPAESVTRGAVLLSCGYAATLVSAAGIQIVAARFLPTDAYGRFAVALLLLTWTGTILSSAFLPGLSKIVSENERWFRAVLTVAAKWYSLAALALAAAFCLTAGMLARLFGDPGMTVLFVLVGVQIPLKSVVYLGTYSLSGLRRFLRTGGIKISDALAGALGACAFLVAGCGEAGAMGGLVAGTALAAVLAGILMREESRGRPMDPYPAALGRLAYWASLSLPTSLGIAVLMTLDMWLVKGLVKDSNAAGVYAVAYSLSRFPMFLVYGLAAAIFPSISAALAAGDRPLARTLSAQAMRFLMLAFVPICLITASCAREIIVFVFSSRYGQASASLVVLVAAIFLSGQMHLALGLLAGADRPGHGFAIVAAAAAAGLAANLLLIPRLGIVGAAVASLIAFSVGAVAGTALVYVLLGALPPIGTAVRSGLAGGVAYGLGRLWPAAGWLVVGKIALLSLLYVAVLLLLRELSRKDVAAMRQSVWR